MKTSYVRYVSADWLPRVAWTPLMINGRFVGMQTVQRHALHRDRKTPMTDEQLKQLLADSQLLP